MGSVGHHGYARKVPEGLFRKNMSHWGDSARLMATRFAYDSEFEQDTVLNAERIRVLTGEDEVDGNEKMRAFKYFDLLAKFMISTNVMPLMSSRDPLAVREATLRRLAIIPMNQPLNARWSREELPTLFAALNAEHEGILAWMVAGAKEWYALKSLKENLPAAMEAQRASYAKDRTHHRPHRSGAGDGWVPVRSGAEDAGVGPQRSDARQHHSDGAGSLVERPQLPEQAVLGRRRQGCVPLRHRQVSSRGSRSSRGFREVHGARWSCCALVGATAEKLREPREPRDVVIPNTDTLC